ncbi:immunoglobulin-like domain-containing protein [Colwellia echini]|uniref:DUF5011 domain-containing protein n=1 Tax=Colwellia echini TaxID=1982103 RepID=A0ABY3MTH5_9GAMM|nr:immunoglobulin-like domain-containing protein [Colwellia echini]TYK64421.1 DUF5011 domain-containing protein [Colwellia echini]
MNKPYLTTSAATSSTTLAATLTQKLSFNAFVNSVKNFAKITIALSALTLTACGGSSDAEPTPEPNPAPVTPTPDTTAPVITLNGESSITLSAGVTYEDSGATAVDDTDGDVTVTSTGVVDINAVNTYTLTFNATDAAGNASSATRTVTVIDDTSPSLSLNGESIVTHNVGDIYTDAGVTATDNIDTANDLTIDTTGNVLGAVVGTYTLTYTTTDTAGNNSNEVSRTVNVVDNLAPVITLIGDANVMHNYGEIYTDQGTITTDNVDTSITATTSDVVMVETLGSYLLTYTATDTADNQSTITRTVNVIDNVAPVLTLIGDAEITLNVGDVYTDEGATVTDAVDSTVTVNVESNVDVTAVGDYFITYTSTDASNNSAIAITRSVEVVDTIAPVLTLNGDVSITLGQGRTFVDLGATAVDNADGEFVIKATSSDLDITALGTYTATYTATDSSSNVSNEVTRTIEVVATRPFITTWKTDNDGISDDNTIVIPTNSTVDGGDYTYNYTVEWGDGDSDTGITGDATHSYATPGEYEVKISGDFPHLDFYGQLDNNKLISIDQWGDIAWLTMERAFYYCLNVTSVATDTPDLSQVTHMTSMFINAKSFNGDVSQWQVGNVIKARSAFENTDAFNSDISKWDVSSMEDIDLMFKAAININPAVSNWDTHNINTMRGTFDGTTLFNQDLSQWNVTNLEQAQLDFISNTAMSVENYDALLISWSQQPVKSGVRLDVDNTQHSIAGQAAKDILINTYGWEITDDGLAP